MGNRKKFVRAENSGNITGRGMELSPNGSFYF